MADSISSKNYYIFRHGETFATKRKVWYWHRLYSATILEEGKPSVIRLAKSLKEVNTDYNVSSPFIRCRQTAELVTSETGKKFEIDTRIGERTIQLKSTYQKKVLSFLNEMEDSNHQNILICTHSAAIKVIIKYLSKNHISNKERVKAPLPGVLTIIKNGKLEEINFNENI